MLLDSFFFIRQITPKENNAFAVQLQLNPEHPIFSGHLPGNPIVPGVCLTQMVKEIIEQISNQKLRLTAAGNIKFTAIVDPRQHSELDANLQLNYTEDHKTTAELSFFSGNTTFYKFKGSFQSH